MAEQDQNDQEEDTVRDCHHLTDHPHGTSSRYIQDGCRCTACRAANTAAKKAYRTAVAYGRHQGRLVDAEPVRRHVQDLRDQGLSLQATSHATGVALATLNALTYGVAPRGLPPTVQLRADTAGTLLGLTADLALLPAAALVPATGSRRRLQALACAGWSTPLLSSYTPVSARTLNRLLSSSADNTAAADTARAIAALYNHLRHTAPTRGTESRRLNVVRTAKRAESLGWRPAHFWHDIDHDLDLDLALEDDNLEEDDPVDEIAIERAIHGENLPLTSNERLEAVARLTSRGFSALAIGKLLHLSERHVVRLRRRYSNAA